MIRTLQNACNEGRPVHLSPNVAEAHQQLGRCNNSPLVSTTDKSFVPDC